MDHSLAERPGDILLCSAVLKQTCLWEGWEVIPSGYMPFLLGCVPHFRKSCLCLERSLNTTSQNPELAGQIGWTKLFSLNNKRLREDM